jgi:hypothetical protein
MFPRTIWRTPQSVNSTKVYWPLSLVVELGTAELDPIGLGMLDDEGLVSVAGALDDGEVVSVVLPDGGVAEGVAVESVGGMADGLGDVELVLEVSGGIVDVDEDVDGVTMGGVLAVGAVVDDSRSQPATLNTSPAQNNVAKAVFMVDLPGGCEKECPLRI